MVGYQKNGHDGERCIFVTVVASESLKKIHSIPATIPEKLYWHFLPRNEKSHITLLQNVLNGFLPILMLGDKETLLY